MKTSHLLRQLKIWAKLRHHLPLKENFRRNLGTQLAETCRENKITLEIKLVKNRFIFHSLVHGYPHHPFYLRDYTYLLMSSMLHLYTDWVLNCTKTRQKYLFCKSETLDVCNGRSCRGKPRSG